MDFGHVHMGQNHFFAARLGARLKENVGFTSSGEEERVDPQTLNPTPKP